MTWSPKTEPSRRAISRCILPTCLNARSSWIYDTRALSSVIRCKYRSSALILPFPLTGPRTPARPGLEGSIGVCNWLVNAFVKLSLRRRIVPEHGARFRVSRPKSLNAKISAKSSTAYEATRKAKMLLLRSFQSLGTRTSKIRSASSSANGRNISRAIVWSVQKSAHVEQPN